MDDSGNCGKSRVACRGLNHGGLFSIFRLYQPLSSSEAGLRPKAPGLWGFDTDCSPLENG